MGPLGGPRPFAREELTVTAVDGELELEYGSKGRFLGVPRPLAKADPVSQADVQKCMNSQAAEKYVNDFANAFNATIKPKKKEQMKRAWCKGELSFAQNP